MFAVKKRIAKKILKYRDRLRYTPQQVKRAEEKLGVASPPPAEGQSEKLAQK